MSAPFDEVKGLIAERLTYLDEIIEIDWQFPETTPKHPTYMVEVKRTRQTAGNVLIALEFLERSFAEIADISREIGKSAS